MGIDEIKRWQWIVVGLLVGFGLGWAWTSHDPDTDGKLLNQIDFERLVDATYAKTGAPYIKNIVLEPLTTDYRNKTVQLIRFRSLQTIGAKTGRATYASATFIAPVPYMPMLNGPRPPKPNLTPADYLANLAKTHPDLTFQYGWYNERPAALTLWTLGSVLLIGGIWPTVLNLMVGAGIGGPRVKKEKTKKEKKEDYFDRFSHGPDPHTTAVRARAGVTDADRQNLEDMNAMLEKNVASAIDDNTTVTIAADQKSGGQKSGDQKSAEVRKLQGGPLEVSATTAPAEEDDVEVKGEFYPVIIHHKKHADDDPQKPSE